jgi:hypothetical protein
MQRGKVLGDCALFVHGSTVATNRSLLGPFVVVREELS